MLVSIYAGMVSLPFSLSLSGRRRAGGSAPAAGGRAAARRAAGARMNFSSRRYFLSILLYSGRGARARFSVSGLNSSSNVFFILFYSLLIFSLSRFYALKHIWNGGMGIAILYIEIYIST